MATFNEHVNNMPLAPPNYGHASAPAVDGIYPSKALTEPLQQQPQQLLTSNPPLAFGPNSMRVQCPSCHEQTVTRIDYVNSTKTHIIAVVLLCTVCCCCIPYLMKSCKNANHMCSSCGAYLGTYTT